jgi:hypothetical protein
MKKYLLFFGLAFSLIQCSKPVENVSETIPSNLTVISQGSFIGAAHTVTGVVKLSKDASGKKYLVFDNFNTQSGPDLRIWMAEDLSGKVYSEITSTVKNGTYSLQIPSDVDTSKKTFVLVWCKQFTVLFGSAALK